jgi:uncharacterized protein (UPF0261 family)
MAKAVLIVATMDTKGKEVLFVKERFDGLGVPVITLDAGIMGESPFPTTVTRQEVARAGGMELSQVRTLASEGEALGVMIQGAIKCAQGLYREGKIGGIIGMGGSMGTTLGTGVMRSFPVGFPKVMISTMASRNTRPFVGTKDIMMLHSVCDLSGINRITARVLRNGTHAMAGMLRDWMPYETLAKPLVLLSTLGTTETCAQIIRQGLLERGQEVVAFHTVGSGGEAMERLIEEEEVTGVIDLSLHEIVDHHFGGDYDAGPNRGLAAIQKGIPTVLIPGNTDFLVSGPLGMTRERFPGRAYHVHNAAITAVRTDKREVEAVAGLLARFCGEATGPVAILVPLGGFSVWDREGGPFHNPEAVKAFVDVLQRELPVGVALHLADHNVNDEPFAHKALEVFESVLTARQG